MRTIWIQSVASYIRISGRRPSAGERDTYDRVLGDGGAFGDMLVAAVGQSPSDEQGQDPDGSFLQDSHGGGKGGMGGVEGGEGKEKGKYKQAAPADPVPIRTDQ